MSSFDKLDRESFIAGYAFAQRLVGSLGHKPTTEELRGQLTALSSGDITILPTPAELADDLDKEAGAEGEPLWEALKSSIVNGVASHRKGRDEFDRAAATFVLSRLFR